jgi:hypothetical protein
VTARYSVESYTNHFENLYREIYKNGKGRRYSEEEGVLLNALNEVYEDLERNSDDIFRMKTIMAEKEEVLRSVLNSKSWRATAPLRVIWKYIKSVR